MNHRSGFNRLSRKAGHRKALHKNMVTSLFLYERITTTKAKALAIRKTAEKMVTRAKADSVHNRREIAKRIKNPAVLAKLFTEIGPRFVDRPGGYTRILKIGLRQGDAAEMVILELVEKGEEKKTKKSSSKKPAKEAAPKPEKPVKKSEEVKAKTTVETKTKVKKEEVTPVPDEKEEIEDTTDEKEEKTE
jgi:large subunit ribosomal protein L17